MDRLLVRVTGTFPGLSAHTSQVNSSLHTSAGTPAPISAAVNEDNGFGNLRESVMGESLDSVEGTGAHPE